LGDKNITGVDGRHRSVKVKVHHAIDEIPRLQWNQLVWGNNPFLRHEFLHAMETHQCVGEKFGWIPRHLGVYDNNELIGAMPLYEKHNSYGEFVFDNAWADAYQRNGIPYYPKLVSAIPYTPAQGQRLLVRTGLAQIEVYQLLLNRALQLTRQLGCSGFHCLFPVPVEHQFLSQQMPGRHDCQFHWRNRNYRDFEDFISRLNAKKRKNIRQERRRAADSGVVIRCLDGYSASEDDWRNFTRFYDQTFREKWGMATFNYEFFREVAAQMPDQILLVLADLEEKCIAGALMYRGDNVLYGRHWGCVEQIDALHFEVCYYRGIEYCIDQGLDLFEPGAQGEHKMARGFLPTRTQSSHWVVDEHFREPISQYIEHERAAVRDYMVQLSASSPYRREPAE